MSPTDTTAATPSRSKLLTFAGAAFVCILASLTTQQLWVASRNGFGSGDITAFICFGAPFAVFLGFLALGFVAVLRRAPAMVRHGLALIVGAGFGILWTILVRFMLGPWFGAFSFPVIYFWMFGGFLGLLFASLYAIRRDA